MQGANSVDVGGLERELCRISEVTAARVVVAPDGRVAEVHILSLPHKQAKQVVRDVQSVALASFGIDLDRRVVSVVQLDALASSSVTGPDVEAERDRGSEAGGTGGAGDGPGGRIHVDAVVADRNGLQCTVRVVLTRGEQRATGTAEGIAATSTVLRLVAQATLAALRHLEPAAVGADVETATIIRIGDRAIAVTTVVVVVPPHEEAISGSAIVRPAGELDAVARAMLDATNRRLPRLR